MQRLIFALTALVINGIGAAADAPNYGPIPSWVKPVEVSTPAEAGDTAPIMQMLQDQQFNFLPQSQEVFAEIVVRIQNAQGLQSMGTLQLPWKPDTDILTIHKVHVRRGDQVINALADGQKFTLLRRENNLEYSALDGVLTAAFQPPDLRVGDILDVAFSIKRSEPILAGSAEQVGGGWIQGPVAHVNLRARWPRSSQIRWRSTDGSVGLKEQQDGDFTEVSYSADNVVPPVQPVGAPLRFLTTREVEFSGFKSWAEVSKRLAPLYVNAETLAATSALKAEVSRIKSTTRTPIERAGAALSLVEDDVRYVFLGMNQGGIVPAQADVTWSRRFGDCKAKTVLLIALLRELDIQAEPVAVSTRIGDGLDARLPMVGFFDHVIVRAHIDGKVYWLDGTRSADSGLRFLKTPNYHWGLPLLPAGGELTRLETAPLDVPDRTTTIQIDATAGILVPAPFHVESVVSGDAALAMKMQLATLTGDSLERGLRDYWGKMYDFVDVKAVSANFDNATESETLTMDGSARLGWKDEWYETDGLGVGFEAQFTRPAGSNVKAPYAVSFPLYVVTTEKILLPKGPVPFTTSGGPYDSTIGGVEYKRTFSLVGGTFIAQASSRSIAPEFPAADAVAAQAALRAMAKDVLYLRKPDGYVLTPAEVADEMSRKLSTSQEYLDRGVMLLNRGDNDRALADFDQAVALDAKSDYALANRGMTYFWKNDYGKAVQDWDAADALNPKNPVMLRGRGALAFRQNKISVAIAKFTDSLQSEPGNTFALTWRALAYERANQPADVIADSSAVLQQTPGDSSMYRVRGTAYARSGQVDLAMADARALIAAEANYDSYLTAAAIFAAAGKLDEARQAVDHILDAGPDERGYLIRAALRPPSDQSGRRADIDAALRLNPRSIQALFAKATAQNSEGQYADAVASLTSVIDIGSANFNLLMLRLSARAKAGQGSLAEADAKQARGLATSPPMLNDLCWAMATNNVALDDALSVCDEALAARPGVSAFLDSKGFVLLRLKRYSESISAYDASLAITPERPASLYGRGLAKRAIGDVAGGDHDISAARDASKGIADTFASYGVQP